MMEGMDVVTKIENTPVDGSKPIQVVVIADCGELLNKWPSIVLEASHG